MTSTVSSLAPAHAVIEVVHTGDVSASDLREVAKKVRELAGGQTPVHVLSDFSAATDLPGTLELLNLVDLVTDAGVGEGFRQALLWPAGAAERIELDVLKTGEQNRGLAAKAFGDREAALAWLES